MTEETRINPEKVSEDDKIKLTTKEMYVGRAGLKLSSVAKALKLDFRDKIVLDVGSSPGGFTDYALQHGAKKVIAVELGTDQLHPSLHGDPRIELHEKTDIRNFVPAGTFTKATEFGFLGIAAYSFIFSLLFISFPICLFNPCNVFATCFIYVISKLFFTYYFFIFIIFSVPYRSFFKGLCCIPYTFPLQFHVSL